MKLLAPVLLAGAFALAGCHKDTKTTTTERRSGMGMVNTNCPFTGRPVNADSVSTDYKGQTVGFCCNGCKGKFNAMSDAEKSAKLAK